MSNVPPTENPLCERYFLPLRRSYSDTALSMERESSGVYPRSGCVVRLSHCVESLATF